MSDVTYYLDGVDLKTYGVYVSASDGLISKPKLKSIPVQDWKDYHGYSVDMSRKIYDSRTIKLQCFIKAANKEDFSTKMNTFMNVFDVPKYHRLMVVVDEAKPLVYEVYLSGEIDPKKKWSDDTMVGTFTLDFVEPEPIKRVLQYTRTGDTDKTVSITVSSPKLLNIYWGDGDHTFDVSGTSQTVTHTYLVDGTYNVVVTGNIDEITSFTTTATVIWSKL